MDAEEPDDHAAPPPGRAGGAPVAPPPPEALDITPDGLLKKAVECEGTGDVPPMHSRCLVHYVGRLAATGEVFMDSRAESSTGAPVTLVAGRDATRRESGLHLAAATMRRGERARVWAAPVHGYGPAGSFSFPTVPPDSHLAYDLELLDWEPPEEGRPARAMLFEERLEAAARRRADGNAAFAAGRLAEALERYALALSYVDEELMIQLEGFHHEKATAERSAALLNAAAAHLRLGDAAAAAAAAGAALAGDPGNAKALFRRGAARRALGQTAAAVEDLAAAARGAPGDAGVTRELAAARAAVRAERVAGDALFRGVVVRGEARQASGGGEAVAPATKRAAVGWAAAALRAVCPCAFRRRKAHAE